MLLHGNRDNASNLFSVDLISGEITQLTDYPRGKKYLSFQNTYINPARKEAYYWYQGRAWKLRERKVENERVGHEYWYADGTRIGYHGDSALFLPA